MLELALLAAFLLLAAYAGWRSWHLASQADASPDLFEEEEQASEVPEAGRLERFVFQLGLPVEPWLFVIGVLLLAVLVFLSLLEFIPGAFGLAGIATAGVVALGLLLLSDMIGWRTRRFETRLLDAMDLINAALRGGLPARQALQAAAESSEKAVRQELQEMVKRLDLGLSVEQSVQRINNRYRSEGVRLFTQALVAKWHSGSDFSALLESVSGLIRDRVKLRLQIEGQLSGARYAGLFSGFLPYLLIPLFMWRQPDWLQTLISHPQGPSYLVGAIFLQAIGFIWLRRVLRVSL